MAKSAGAAAILLGLTACALGGNPAPFAGPFDAGLMSEPQSREASGLVASRLAPNLLWTNDDSGGQPVLYALDATTGARRGRLRIDGVRNIDWEDLAAFELDGRAWLLIADVGDNLARRASVWLHVVPEPDPTTLAADTEITVRPAYSIQFTYEDLARDCEAVAVDAASRTIYLLTKRESTPRLYALPLQPANGLVVARRVGEVPHLPQPSTLQRAIALPAQAFRGQPTALDFATDGSAAIVLTYGDTLLFPRESGESWAAALAREPLRLPAHHLPQAEAACFSSDGGAIFVCSERTLRLLRYRRDSAAR